jgi:hypothetical protein
MATLFVDKIDPQSGTSLEIGSSGDTISKGSGVVSRLGVFESQLLHVQDQQASGNAANSVVGFQTRNLNTILTNEITGASLSSNQITLPAGTYYIDAEVPGYFCQRHNAHLNNDTDGAIIVVGSSAYTNANVVTHSFINGRFTISSQKNFSITQYFQVAASAGLGISSSNGVTASIFTNVRIWRTA